MRKDRTVIEIRNVTKTYANRVSAISRLSLDVPKGIIFGLLGPNGSGKTTLIEILVGLVKPTSGKVWILGNEPWGNSNTVKKYIGYLPENPGMYENMSGLRFLSYMGQLSGLNGSQAKKKAEELLAWVGLENWKDFKIRSYSAGMKQRLAFIHSLLNDPEVLFLDEPTVGLDPVAREKILEKIKEMAEKGTTVFMATQLLIEIERIADYFAIIDNGQLIRKGSMKEFARERNLLSAYRDALIKTKKEN